MSITVLNNTTTIINVFISKYSGGDDNWFPLAPGQKDTWTRSGWELVAFKFEDDDRRGIYVRPSRFITVYGKDNIIQS